MQLHPQATTVDELRAAWQAADALGVDSIWVWDHFYPLYGDPDAAHFEAYTLLAAMAADTEPRAARRARHVQLVPQPQPARRHGAHHRPPQRRPVHPRHRLGLVRARLHEYGYEFGTAPSRLRATRARRCRVIKDAARRAQPRRPSARCRSSSAAAARRSRCGSSPSTPTRGTPSGRPRTSRHKNAVLDEWCAKVGRDPAEIERTVAISASEVDDLGGVRRGRRRPPHRDDGRPVRPRRGGPAAATSPAPDPGRVPGRQSNRCSIVWPGGLQQSVASVERSSNDGCRAARPRPHRVPTGATARPGPAGAAPTRPRPTSRPARVPARPPSRTPSCTAHSNFSFLDGASSPRGAGRGGRPARPRGPGPHRPRRLLRRGALRRGGPRRSGLPTVFGAELTLDGPGPSPALGAPDPPGDAPGGAGPTARRATPALARPLSRAQLARARRARPASALDELADLAGTGAGHWVVLTGCRKGTVPRPLEADGPGRGGARAGPAGRAASAATRCAVELWDHGDPLDSARNDALAELAVRGGVELVATNNVHYATPLDRPAGHGAGGGAGPPQPRRARRLAARPPPAPTCGRGPSRPAGSPATPAWSSARGRAGPGCAFDLQLVAPRPAAVPVPRRPRRDGVPAPAWSSEGAARRYGPPPRRHGERDQARAAVRRQIDHELDVIEHARLPRLLPHRVGHRASSAASTTSSARGGARRPTRAVCYALGITKADAVRLGPAVRALPVARARRPARHRPRHRERPARGGHPVRLRALRPRQRRPGGQRHHLPGPLRRARHGQGPRLRARPAGRLVQAGRPRGAVAGHRRAGRPRHPRRRCWTWPPRSSTSPATSASTPAAWCICDRPVVEVCPVEWARMEDRTVLQWDKDDCAAVGLVKFDLLGLGMLTALHYAVDLIRRAPRRTSSTWPPSRRRTRSTTCSAGPTRSACSRWSAGPRWPRCPGCDPGPSTTSWWRWRSSARARSRAARCTPTSAAATARSRSPTSTRCWSRALAKTLGVPLFQEQLMQMAIDVAGFSPGRGRPAAPGDGLEASAGADGAAARPALRRAWPSGASPARWPTRSATSWPRSPTSASPRATR